MKLNEVLKMLKEQEARSLKKGYRGDATNYAFKRYALILLNEIAGKKRKPSAWNLFVGKYLKQGKTVKDAAEDWKKKGK